MNLLYLIIYFFTIIYLQYGDEKDNYFNNIIKNFNLESKRKDWNIHLISNPYSYSENDEDYNSYMEKRLNNSTDIDMFIFNHIYLKRYSDYLQNLRLYISNDHFKCYFTKSGEQTNIYNNHIYSLPLYIEYGVLYSNKELLDKYNLTPPKTWDELVNTTQYIIKTEKKKQVNDIVGYAGLMPLDDELCFCSIYELLYSYRNNLSDPIPNFRSQNAVAAMDKIYYIKKNISSDDIFKLNSKELFDLMIQKKVIFSKNWYKKGLEDKYYISIIPGYKKGISGSTINGYNIGINKYIKKENKIAAAQAIMYFTNEINQIQYSTEFGNISGMDTIYNNQTFCKNNPDICNIYTNSQPIVRPFSLLDNYEEYSKKFRDYITKFLYNNTDDSYDIKSSQTLGKIEDMAKVYFIENTSTLGKFSIWGICIMLGYLYTNIGEMLLIKCQVKTVLLSVGFSLTITLQCLKLISNYPYKSHIVILSKKYFAIIMSCIIWIDVGICTLFIGVSYKNNIYYNNEDINFQKCQFESLNVIVYAYCVLNFFINFFCKLFIPSKYYEINNINIKKYAVFNRDYTKDNVVQDIVEPSNRSNENISNDSNGNKFNDIKEKIKNYHNGNIYNQ
ncbi:hypothetical protein PIROE2DRAFT_12193 [Piromyces sp. E2]|nr:hypothetical protein PIROE2DRAFT_12193 [Piromyces sp. E2]|eukprot:OUM61737.1 hypothetical protein PIROE2DRAFT_12193 [Piromyces sp. E2]